MKYKKRLVLVSGQKDGMRQKVRDNQRYLQLILALLAVLLLLSMSGWLR